MSGTILPHLAITRTGGVDCPLLKSTAANTAAIAASGAAVLTVSQLLPFSYVRHLSSDVLRSLQAIARAPTGAAPVDLSTLDAQGLVDSYQQGRADLDAIRPPCNEYPGYQPQTHYQG